MVTKDVPNATCIETNSPVIAAKSACYIDDISNDDCDHR